MCLPCLFDGEFKSSPGKMARVNELLSIICKSVPPSKRTFCNTHLLCKPSAQLSCSMALVAHDVIVKDRCWSSADELGVFVDKGMTRLYQLRLVYYGLELFTYLAVDKDMKAYFDRLAGALVDQYIGDVTLIPCTMNDYTTEYGHEWDYTLDAAEMVFGDVMIAQIGILDRSLPPVSITTPSIDELVAQIGRVGKKTRRTSEDRGRSTDQLRSQIADLKLSGTKRANQIKKLKKSNAAEVALCPICMADKRTTALHCGHVLCTVCSESLKKCPFCAVIIDTSASRTLFL